MADLFKNVYIQGGAFGLLTISGWVCAWLLWRDNCRLRNRLFEVVVENTKSETTLAERLR